MALVVRQARPDDTAKMGELAVLLGEQHVGYDPVRFPRIVTREGAERLYSSRVDAENAALLVAELDGSIVGFAFVEYEPRAFEDILENAVWLHDIYVDETARGNGAGRALMDGVIEATRQFNAEKTVLAVAAKNHAAQRFFEGLGFKTTMHEMMLVVSDR